MAILTEPESRDMQAELLERRFPEVRARLLPGEALLAVSHRSAHMPAGVFSGLIGVFLLQQILFHFLLSEPLLSVLGLCVAAAALWLCIRLTVHVKRGFVFVTDARLVHVRVNAAGHVTKTPLVIPVPEISGVHLYRNALMFAGKKRTNGDILITKKNGATSLIPSLTDSVGLSEILMAEVSRNKTRAASAVDRDQRNRGEP